LKVLAYCPVPFWLAHGGEQVQIEQTLNALREIGVEVEPARWWDGAQRGDVLQYFGRVPMDWLRLARQKGMKVAVTSLLSEQGSRSRSRLWAQRWATRFLNRTLPMPVRDRFGWDSYSQADACVVNTSWEAHLVHYLFGAPHAKVHVVPNGVERVFLESAPLPRGKWLVCTATITPRKRVLELAQAAVIARTPVWVVGKPYSEKEDYARQFLALAQQHPEVIRYEGPVQDRGQMARIYREARGFVLLSTMETRSLSSEEAVACECPLLLCDLPWARSTFADQAVYCTATGRPEIIAPALAKFYAAAPGLKPPARPCSWVEVAGMYRRIYEGIVG
jgi:glycosyltransferase involved in cell wall biosynthesis